MRCQVCNKNPARVHVTEVQGSTPPPGEGAPAKFQFQQRHLCEACAQTANLTTAPVAQSKTVVDIWKLLQQSAQRSRRESGLTCEACGMTLAEFRSRGRLGCPACYAAFAKHLQPLLQRIHNSVRHTGRVPGDDPETQERRRRIRDLKQALESAIREEAYEDAARLRDDLQSMESEEGPRGAG